LVCSANDEEGFHNVALAKKKTLRSAKSTPYLKSRVYWRTRAYLLLGLTLIVWVDFGAPTTGIQLRTIPAPAWITAAVTTVFSVLVVAIDSLPGPNLKAFLVFWRRKDPLPGARAFDKASLDRDTRIDRERLRGVVGGTFPRAAKEQNSTWYRLYKSVQTDVAVEAMHYHYLLFRDFTWVSVVLGALALVNLIFSPVAPGVRALWVPAIFAALYLIFRRGAAERGQRFVNQVLVTVSVFAPTTSPKP
jgi:hypothetical protein